MMIRLVFFAILLIAAPLLQAGLIFDESEKVVEIFQSQDFDANLAKAEEGNVRAQYLVGVAYLYGLEEQEVEVDHEKGLHWLKAAARQGAAEAFDELAIAYSEGLGVDKGASKYEAYLAEAGERGMSSAKLDLLDLYRDGDPELGIEPNEEKYLYWLEKTAEDGVLISMRNMAHRYRQGRGFEVDYEKAFEWVMRAVNLDDLTAQRMAGEYFEKGMVVDRNLVKAYMLYDLAGTSGIEKRDRVAKQMTDEQVEEAIARSWQWQLEHNSYRPSSNGNRYRPDVSDLEPLSLTPESDQ
ncbi:tetratricopeptide repeat protein [Halomonas mongoliensis]|uniref:Tetratricopeptide repeat protein n=1 Tax=Halomonas mongoliensis TaxID=321265 RepID=A0ABU1GQV0_9GAMM|nr:tetratricopeptide repeat protein [Halomonas mongoliensis]MDR5894419.1 tetratricopeptide repeat protein [Halomonas mongoliensis]